MQHIVTIKQEEKFMAQQCGTAGDSVRKMAFDRYVTLALTLAAMAVLSLVLLSAVGAKTLFGPWGFAIVALAAGSMKLLMRKAKWTRMRAKHADRGAEAEEKVAIRLNALPDGYYGFHDISFSGFNVDHIVVGPGGIFVVETKSHRGKITANGDSLLLNGKAPIKDFIKQTWSQTYQVRELLKEQIPGELPIKPILCFTNAFISVRGPVKGIVIANISYLNKYLLRQRRAMKDAEIKLVVEFLRLKMLKELPPEGGLVKVTTFKDFG
jgi:hypothetical protein